MRSTRSTSKSQLFAAGVTLAAISAMLVPLRSGPSDMQTQQAGFIPLLAASGVAETNAFRRFSSVQPVDASVVPLVRTASGTFDPQINPLSPETPLPHDFRSPRIRWMHLSAETRAALDATLGAGTSWESVELHGSSATSTKQLDRIHRLVRGASSGHPYHVILGDEGVTVRSQTTETTSLHLCFTGEFHTAPPSASQLAALDEVIDYLTIKLGPIPVRAHTHDRRSCLGASFRVTQIITALEEAR